MIALIVGNGEVDASVKTMLPERPYIICADGGIRHMTKLGLKADIVIGDMDSSTGDVSDAETIVYPVKKDFTDSELAIRYALKNGYKEIYMIGFTGTRLDHTLTNLFLLTEIQNCGAKGILIDSNNVIFLADTENEIHGDKGDLVSIIPITEEVLGVVTEGLEYPLNNEILFFGKSRGVSNVMSGKTCRILIKQGKALIIKSKD